MKRIVTRNERKEDVRQREKQRLTVDENKTAPPTAFEQSILVIRNLPPHGPSNVSPTLAPDIDGTKIHRFTPYYPVQSACSMIAYDIATGSPDLASMHT